MGRQEREGGSLPTTTPSLLPAQGSGTWHSMEIILAHVGNCPVGGRGGRRHGSFTAQNSKDLLGDTCVGLVL